MAKPLDPNGSGEISSLLSILPLRIKKTLSESQRLDELLEVVLDLGKPVEIRFKGEVIYLKGEAVTLEEIDYLTSRVGEFTGDNRAGIERTLHRISGIRNRRGRIIGLTCRVGRAILGTIDIIRDVVESGKNLLFLGPPGIGKTTKLREAARVLSEQFEKRVIVIDTSNEIAGDGDIPHPGIGRARRMQVSSPDRQHAVMIEAVENHMPEVIIVDEIGTEAEAHAARTIAERGVQLIGTAHGNVIENLLKNPTLADLLGGIQSVILSDEEAKRRHTQKAILERRAPPTFDTVIEIRERDTFAIYHSVAEAVDRLLRGRTLPPEIRIRRADGKVEATLPPAEMPEEFPEEELARKSQRTVRIYPFAVNRSRLERALRSLELDAEVTNRLDEADLVLTVHARTRPGARILKTAEERRVPVHVIRANTASHIMRFLRHFFQVTTDDTEREEAALRDAEDAVRQAFNTRRSQNIAPQNAYLRRRQHQMVNQAGLRSESVGEEPTRHLRIYPPL